MDTAAVSAAFAGADQDIMPATNKDVETLNKIKDVLTKKKNKIIKADEDEDEATYEKEMTALKQFVNNNKKIISKNEDIKNIISSIIDIK
jgi:ribosomal protein S18